MIREASPSVQLRKKPSDASQSDAFTPKSPKRANRSQWLDLGFSVDGWSQCECGTGGELLRYAEVASWKYIMISYDFCLIVVQNIPKYPIVVSSRV